MDERTCRKKKASHKSAGTDDKKLQNALKRLQMQTIAAIEEVNMMVDDRVIHFSNPKVQANIQANTYVVSGPSQNKAISDLLPGIIPQLGPDNIQQLQKMAAQMKMQGGEGDDDVPDLVENFEEEADVD